MNPGAARRIRAKSGVKTNMGHRSSTRLLYGTPWPPRPSAVYLIGLRLQQRPGQVAMAPANTGCCAIFLPLYGATACGYRCIYWP
jgi:hypothetical protein